MDEENLVEEQEEQHVKESSTTEEPVKKPAEETVEETIAKSISELAKAEEEPKEEVKQTAPRSSRKAKDSSTSSSDSESIQAPNDWSAEGKEAFKRFDPAAQKELARLSKDYQAYRQREVNNFIKQRQSFEQERGHFKSITDTVTRFLPLWGRDGITAEAALSEVCSFYTQYMHDPESALLDLAQRAQIKLDIPNRKRSQEKADPQFNALTQRLESVENLLNSSQTQAVQYQTQALGAQIDEEFEGLRDEEAQPGKYKYPDLHDPQFCRQHIEPLVIALAKANPEGANWSELIKRSYIASGGRVVPSNVSTRLNGQRSMAAQRAASSISGVGGSQISGGDLPFIPNESVEDTIRRTLAMSRSR